MTVLTTPVSVRSLTPLAKAAIRGKPIADTRPVTATLECPVVLDITFLKKLDMTSFTKKGLMAISRICGISLVKRTDDKKIRKRIKRQTMDRARKEARRKSLKTESSEEAEKANGGGSAAKGVPKIKVSDGSAANGAGTECGKNAGSGKSLSPRVRSREVKPTVDDILYGHVEIVVTEPCKACGRSEQPERFHSHPKQGTGRKQKKGTAQSGDSGRGAQEGKLLAPKVLSSPKNPPRRHSTGHLQSESTSKLAVADVEPSFHSDHEIESMKMSLPKVKDASASLSQSMKVHRNKPKKDNSHEANTPKKIVKKSGSLSEVSKTVKSVDFHSPKRSSQKEVASSSPGDNPSGQSTREDLKYVTGCYVCGQQMSADLRLSHEEQCIAEWRKQNSQLPPDMRKAEPLRPDFRFTAAGDVDFEGTFSSIWANHMDSLVPCGKCKRTFFPERIEKHEACCTGQSTKPKHPAPRCK